MNSEVWTLKSASSYERGMCVNAPVSFSAFVIGVIVCVILLLVFRDEPTIVAIALFFLFVVFVQLFEGMAHLGYDELGAHAILVLTALQPVVLGVLLLYAAEVSSIMQIVCGFIIVLYIAYMFYSLNQAPAFNHLTSSEGCKQLRYTFWENVGSLPYFLVAFALAVFLIAPAELAIVFIAVIGGTLVIAALLYSCGGGVPSLWCLTAVAGPLIILLYLLWKDWTQTPLQ